MRGVSGEDAAAAVKVGDPAPDFELPMLLKGVKGRFRLQDWIPRQEYVVLSFYPLNWEESSARQLVEYQAQREKYTALNAEFVTVSVDSIMNTTAWEREIGPFDFPMCSDYWPHGEVCKRYGLLREVEPYRGTAERAVFVIDRKGAVRFQKRYAAESHIAFNDVLEILREIES